MHRFAVAAVPTSPISETPLHELPDVPTLAGISQNVKPNQKIGSSKSLDNANFDGPPKGSDVANVLLNRRLFDGKTPYHTIHGEPRRVGEFRIGVTS